MQRLQHQCTVNDIPILNVQPGQSLAWSFAALRTLIGLLRVDPISTLKSALNDTDVVLDAIFGFSFQPPIRSPFDAVLRLIKQSKKPVVSVDIPSGWDVEGGEYISSQRSPIIPFLFATSSKVFTYEPLLQATFTTTPKAGARSAWSRTSLSA